LSIKPEELLTQRKLFTNKNGTVGSAVDPNASSMVVPKVLLLMPQSMRSIIWADAPWMLLTIS
jgi:hypothetical protein